MRKRDRWSFISIAVLLIGLGIALYLMTLAPPGPVSYLPGASGIVYIDLKPLRTAGVFERNQVTPDEDYQQFINATGIDFERDLDEAGFALNEIPASESTLDRRISFSEVLVGRFDSNRLGNYLKQIANEKEHYANREIYNVQMPGRIDRISILSHNAVAISNAPGADEMHSMIDRYRSSFFAALPFEEKPLVRKYYRKVPLGSVFWAIMQLKSSPADSGLDLRHLSGYGFLFPPQTTLVASSRYVGSLQLRAEAFTQNEADAQKLTTSVNTLLHLAGDMESGTHASDANADMAALLKTFKVEQQDSRALVTASLPDDLLRKLFSGKEH